MPTKPDTWFIALESALVSGVQTHQLVFKLQTDRRAQASEILRGLCWEMAQYPMYPSQLPYLPTSGMNPMYMQIPGNYPANYCMPVLGTVNNLGMYGGNIPMGVNNYGQQTPNVTTQNTQEESKEPNRDNVSTSPQLPENNVASAAETSDERAEYIEELNKERDNLEQCKEKESSHVRRLIERGLLVIQ